MDELTLYFDFVKNCSIPTIIFDGNHEATRKNKTFFTNLKRVTNELNPLVKVIDETYIDGEWAILPYADLHKKNSIEDIPESTRYLFTHVRGEIPPHVTPEVDLTRFDRFEIVFAGDTKLDLRRNHSDDFIHFSLVIAMLVFEIAHGSIRFPDPMTRQ